MGSSSSTPVPEVEPKAEPLAPSEKTPLNPAKAEKPPPPFYATLASVVMLIAIAVSKTQLTAALFSSSNYPTAYSLYSCVVTDIILIPCFLVRPSQWAVPTKAMAPTLGIILFFTCFDLAFTNLALSIISSALQQSIASTNPFWTIMFETVLYSRIQHPLVYFMVAMVVVGAVLTGGGEVEPAFSGILFAILAVLSSSLKYVFTHKAFQAFKGQLGALALLFWIDLLLIPIYLIWTVISGELKDLVNVGFAQSSVFWQMTGTAALGGARALSQYVVLVFLTATSMSTANIFTQIFNIIISVVWTQAQKVEVGPSLISGITITVVFSFGYLIIKAYKPFLPWVDSLFGKKADEPSPA